MKIRLLMIAALVAAVALPVWARLGDTSSLEEAALAWDRGDYSAALKIYLQILDSPDAPAALEPIALQTGELYKTTEVTDDGELPMLSPDGRHLAYERGTGLQRTTRLLRLNRAAPPQTLTELSGFGVSFSP